MSRIKCVALWLVGVTILIVAAQPMASSRQVSAQSQVVTKPYLRGVDLPFAPGGAALLPQESIDSPGTAPNYLAYQNYVYQEVFYNNGDWDIAFRQGYGTATNLTSNNTHDIEPDLNQAGDRIVFSTVRSDQYDIASISTSGGSILYLTNQQADEYSPSWSPDGSRVVYVSEKNNKPEIFIINDNGANPLQLTKLPEYGDYEPVFSPDGSRIAFVRQETDIAARIWVMNTDGSDPYALSPLIPYLGRLAWSRDGTLIAFDGDVDDDVWNEIATIRADGSDLQEVYDFNTTNVDAWMGNWSSDMKYLIFTRMQISGGYIGAMGNYMLKLEGGILTNDPADYGLSGLADWFTTDTQAPVTSLRPLPAYSGPNIVLDWDYQDAGPSGIHGVQLQYKYGLAGTWTDVSATLPELPPYTWTPSGCGAYYFRARAEDHAENWEAWPEADYEVSTKRYTNAISGNIIDNHGIPLPLASMSFSPAPLELITLDPFGSFTGHLCNNGDQTISINQPGFGQWEHDTFSAINPTLLTNYYLPPATSVIQNGEFINPISSWTLGGDFPAQSVNLPYARSLRFGGILPITPIEEPISTLDITPMRPLLRVDLEGGRHAVWVDRNFTPATVYYANKPAGDSWSEMLAISDPAYQSVANADMDIDGAGTLHVVWVRSVYVSPQYYNYVMYRTRSSEGIWSAEQDISGALPVSSYSIWTFPEVILDTTGRAHVIWGMPGSINYRSRSAEGTWDGIATIGSGYIAEHFSVTVGPDGNVYVMFRNEASPWGTFFSMKPAGGSWTGPLLMAQNPLRVFERDSLAMQADGKLLFVWHQETADLYFAFYQEMDPSGTWGPIQYLETDFIYPPVFVKLDFLNQPYLFIQRNGFYILKKGPDGQWFYIAKVNHALNDCIFNDEDIPECIFRLKTFRIEIPSAVSTTVTQTVTIPTGLSHATLAFNYSLTKPPESGDFRVSLGGMEIFSTPPAGQMALGSVDVSDWAGQTVPLTFETNYTPMDGKFETYLYNVSLGDWTTPSINDVYPSIFTDSWDGQVVMVSGQNFVEPVSVKLNGIDVPGVIFVDAGTLQVTLPPGLPAGSYRLSITNPTGQMAIKLNAIHLGRLLFSPIILK
jgi:hypothetical protein